MNLEDQALEMERLILRLRSAVRVGSATEVEIVARYLREMSEETLCALINGTANFPSKATR